MSVAIKVIKGFKALFILFRLHIVFQLFSGFIIYLGYLSKLSKWVSKNKNRFVFNDFLNLKVKHPERVKLYKFIVDQEIKEGDFEYLEFGVGRGNSLRWWVENNSNPKIKFWGYDTYTGLPEDWGVYKKGTFSLEGRFPNIQDSRIEFVKGLFQETLIKTLDEIDFSKRLVINLDADLYTSTIYCLTTLYPHLKDNDIIIFDEFSVPLGEFKAFDDFKSSYNCRLEPIGAINNYLQVAFRYFKK